MEDAELFFPRVKLLHTKCDFGDFSLVFLYRRPFRATSLEITWRRKEWINHCVIVH